MHNFINIHEISLIFTLFIIFNILLTPINSISGTKSSSISQEELSKITDYENNENCPCNLNVGTCDPGCYCDQDCMELMLAYDYFNKFPINEESYTEENINSKLDYCDEYIEDLDDLYNPLVLAFKILKRGFCLYSGTKKIDEEDTKNYEEFSQKYEAENNELELEDSKNDFNYGENNFNNSLENITNFESINISVPIALPNGLCLFHSHNIKKNIDYEVTCSYPKDKNQSVYEEFYNENLENKYYYIKEDFYYYNSTIELNSSYCIKKIEIVYDNRNLTYFDHINYYFEGNNEGDYIDLTVEVKFLMNNIDFKLSGNPGYVKGKPIFFQITEKEEEEEKENKFTKNGIIFPIEKGNEEEKNVDEKFIYFDSYMDNKITFDDLIIYGYKNTNLNLQGKLLEFFNLKKDLLKFMQFGNVTYPYNFDIKDNEKLIFIGKYKDSGTVNNTQFQIYRFGFDNLDNNDNYFYNYFIIKFFKLETETNWWYAPGPIVVNLPKNIMYPFKIGTSKYSN